MLKILSLNVLLNKVVGNEMIRGVSGGQRKRITSGSLLFLHSCLCFYLYSSMCP